MTGSTRRRRMIGLAGAMGATLLAAGGVAWACSPQAYLSSVRPGTGLPGSQVRVVGDQFEDLPVEIRWDTAGGAVVGRGRGPSVSVDVTLPAVGPGVYNLVAVQTGAGGQVWQAATAIEVVASFSPPAPAANAPAASDLSTETAGTATPTGEPGTPAPASAAGGDPAPSAGASPSSRPATRVAPQATATPTRMSVAARAPEADTATAAARPTAGEMATDPTVARRAAVADVWSGFAIAPPSLAGRSPAATEIAADGPHPPVGGVIVGAGLVMMLGAALALTRRRRAPAATG